MFIVINCDLFVNRDDSLTNLSVIRFSPDTWAPMEQMIDQYIGLLWAYAFLLPRSPISMARQNMQSISDFFFSLFPDAIILNGLAATFIIYRTTHSR